MRYLCLVLSIPLLGCSSGTAPQSPMGGEGGDGGQSPTIEPLPWTDCDWFTVPPPIGTAHPGPAQCATLSMPLRRDVDLGTIEVFVKRLRPVGRTEGHVWLLDGGPGAEGLTMERYAAAWRERLPNHAFYVPHHRGVGRSTRLDCAGESDGSPNGFSLTASEYIACGQELITRFGPDGLAGFSPSEGAYDLAELITRAQGDEGAPVTVYGGSYGTYLAMRLAALAPADVDAWVLDSPCVPGFCWSAERDLGFDATAQAIFERCRDDTVCAARLGPDPWAKAQEIVDGMPGVCPALGQAGVQRAALKTLLGQLVTTLAPRAAMAPTIARIERCNPEDVDAVLHLFDFVFGGPPSATAGHFGQALYANIVASELYAPGTPDVDAVVAEAEALHAARGTTIFTSSLYNSWPRYTPDVQLATEPPNVAAPMLWLYGGLDPLTPPASIDAFAPQYGGPSQHHVTFPDLGHGIVSMSVLPEHDDALSCGAQLVTSFVAAPEAPLNLDCMAETVPLSWSLSPEAAQAFFGRNDLWD